VASSKAATVDEYLAELPEDRREAIATVRRFILDHLPEGYVEGMNWGMIVYEVPLERYPDTYNKQPASSAAVGGRPERSWTWASRASGSRRSTTSPSTSSATSFPPRPSTGSSPPTRKLALGGEYGRRDSTGVATRAVGGMGR
jgi:hypothetical protein